MLTRDLMEAIGHELHFWKGFVGTDRFLHGWVPSDIKTPELQQEVYEFLVSLPNYQSLRALDIGSGAVSILNGTLPKENIVTIDPLGALYSVVFDYASHGLTPPISAGGEVIDFKEEFDIVHCSNAIDHTQNPLTVYENMHRACRPGGYVIVQSFVDEAVGENWQGFHQFNFRMDQDGAVSYSDKSGSQTHLVGTQAFHALKKNHFQGKDFFISVWRK